MASIRYIEIENFKGIEKTRIDFSSKKNPGRFITLIGLNESGKTTILEAISHSVLSDADTSNLMKSVQGPPEINDLIPRDDKASFTKAVRIDACIDLSDEDIASIHNFVTSNLDFVTDKDKIPRFISISRDYEFKDSSLDSHWNRWSFKLQGKKRGGRKNRELGPADLRDDWILAIEFLRKRLPYILYFPTFLVNFPNRIYLEGAHGNIDKYYRNLLDDALGSLSPSLNIEQHILARARKHRTAGKKSLGSALRSSPEGQQIDATIQRLSAELNRVIFGAWNDIFGKKIQGRRIAIEWHIDEEAGKEIYVEIYIADGLSRYYIQDRSLGFKWFFSFLMFTQFQAKRQERSQTIFLFDEPASHLHARAQTRLLESFQKIADPNHIIVYSTHSHYMINPLWLENAYIIVNSAFNFEEDDPESELSEKRTSIIAVKYKNFVSDNPSQTTYFQPALDALDYAKSPMVINGPAVILEGKYDFYPFIYFKDNSTISANLEIYPATGAGAMEYLISMFRGHRQKFCIVLDDDKAGEKEKRRYISEFLLDENEVFTLYDLDISLKGSEFEGIFKDDLRNIIRNSFRIVKINKSHFYSFFQQVISSGEKIAVPETQAAFDYILEAICKKLE